MAFRPLDIAQIVSGSPSQISNGSVMLTGCAGKSFVDIDECEGMVNKAIAVFYPGAEGKVICLVGF